MSDEFPKPNEVFPNPNEAEVAAFAAMFDKQRRQAERFLGLADVGLAPVEDDAHTTDEEEQS